MVKVLMFSGANPLPKAITGGWISGLLNSFKAHKNDIEISLSFFSNIYTTCSEEDGLKIYPIVKNRSLLSRIKRYLNPKSDEKIILEQVDSVIKSYKPDVIHVFGTETIFGLIVNYTEIPVIIHLQGLMTPYMNAWFPPFYSVHDLHGFSDKRGYKINKYYAERERRIFSSCKYYMGRTDWDKRITEIYSPDSVYFHCNEMLRSEFYAAIPFERIADHSVVHLISVLSSPMYKGHDVILKVAYLLKEKLEIPFEWQVFGTHSMNKAESKLGIKARDCNIKLMGRVYSSDLIKQLQQTDIFIHPSYIDNSPNSICEAQYMGIPVIACNVGGVASLINDKQDGILVPANDPYLIASYVKELKEDLALYRSISLQARETAKKRHSSENITRTLLDIYTKLKKDEYSV